MDFLAVRTTLADLPTSFLRTTGWVPQFQDALGFETALNTSGVDGLLAQVQTIGAAQDGWLDVWGLLAGIPRNQGEGNNPYLTRIEETLLAWVGTLPAVQVWLSLFAPGGTVAENAPGPGYTLTFPSNMTTAQIGAFLQLFNRIRPAGVPFSVSQAIGGLFLGTEEFTGTGGVMGAYLTGGLTSLPLPIAAYTPNSVPLLPSLYLEDPSINPSLAPPIPA